MSRAHSNIGSCFALLVLLSLPPGCGAINAARRAWSSTPAVAGDPWAAHYEEDYCRNNGGAYDGAAQTLLAVMCNDQTLGVDSLPEAPDALRVAAAVASCAARECDVASDRLVQGQLAVAFDLAQGIDPAAITSPLAEADAPDDLKAAFRDRFLAARAHIIDEVGALGAHWLAVFVTPALTARADRAEADRALAAWPATYAALAAEVDAAALSGSTDRTGLERALAMRRDYVAACLPVRHDLVACLSDAVGHAATQLIDRLAIAANDSALRLAEGEIRALPDHTDPRADEYVAAQAALEAEAASRVAYEHAKASGVSEVALAQRWPEPPFANLTRAVFGVLPGEPRESTGHIVAITETEQIRAIVRKGDRATIQFRRDVLVGSVGTGCYETRQVDSIADDGRVIYRQECTGSRKDVTDLTHKPVDVPWSDVAQLAPSAFVHVAIDATTRRGYVAWAGTGSPDAIVRTQLRDFALAVAE